MNRTSKKLKGVTIYVKFNPKDQRIQDFIYNGKGKPEDVVLLKDKLNEKYETLIPIEIRYMFSRELFELMGIIPDYKNAIELFLELKNSLEKMEYDCFISFGFGEVALPEKELPIVEQLHRVSGDGVYAAFQIFKKPQLNKKELPYYFFSFEHKLSFLNKPYEKIQQQKGQFSEKLREIQEME